MSNKIGKGRGLYQQMLENKVNIDKYNEFTIDTLKKFAEDLSNTSIPKSEIRYIRMTIEDLEQIPDGVFCSLYNSLEFVVNPETLRYIEGRYDRIVNKTKPE